MKHDPELAALIDEVHAKMSTDTLHAFIDCLDSVITTLHEHVPMSRGIDGSEAIAGAAKGFEIAQADMRAALRKRLS